MTYHVTNTDNPIDFPSKEEDIVFRLRERASVKEGKPDRIADLLNEAADEIEALRGEYSGQCIN